MPPQLATSAPQGNIIDQILSAAQEAGLDPNLILRLVRNESGLNPDAVSPKGAQGLFQLMPATAAARGVTNPSDPAQNIAGGIAELSDLFSRFGDPRLVVAAFNEGQGDLATRMRDAGTDGFTPELFARLPAETRGLLRRIFGANLFREDRVGVIAPDIVNSLVTANGPAPEGGESLAPATRPGPAREARSRDMGDAVARGDIPGTISGGFSEGVQPGAGADQPGLLARIASRIPPGRFQSPAPFRGRSRLGGLENLGIAVANFFQGLGNAAEFKRRKGLEEQVLELRRQESEARIAESRARQEQQAFNRFITEGNLTESFNNLRAMHPPEEQANLPTGQEFSDALAAGDFTRARQLRERLGAQASLDREREVDFLEAMIPAWQDSGVLPPELTQGTPREAAERLAPVLGSLTSANELANSLLTTKLRKAQIDQLGQPTPENKHLEGRQVLSSLDNIRVELAKHVATRDAVAAFTNRLEQIKKEKGSTFQEFMAQQQLDELGVADPDLLNRTIDGLLATARADAERGIVVMPEMRAQIEARLASIKALPRDPSTFQKERSQLFELFGIEPVSPTGARPEQNPSFILPESEDIEIPLGEGQGSITIRGEDIGQRDPGSGPGQLFSKSFRDFKELSSAVFGGPFRALTGATLERARTQSLNREFDEDPAYVRLVNELARRDAAGGGNPNMTDARNDAGVFLWLSRNPSAEIPPDAFRLSINRPYNGRRIKFDRFGNPVNGGAVPSRTQPPR